MKIRESHVHGKGEQEQSYSIFYKWCKQSRSANLLFRHCPGGWCLAAWQGFSKMKTLSSCLHLLLPWEHCLCAYSSISEHPLWPDTKPLLSVHQTHLYLGLVSSTLGALQATSQKTSNKKLMKMWCSAPSVAHLPFMFCLWMGRGLPLCPGVAKPVAPVLEVVRPCFAYQSLTWRYRTQFSAFQFLFFLSCLILHPCFYHLSIFFSDISFPSC